jgi:hypothetical protein
MAKTSDVIVYLCASYPHKSELSKARLTKLVYLADWMSAQERGRQMTSIIWYFHNYGPYVDDVIEEARLDPRVQCETTSTIYGDPKIIISLKPGVAPASDLEDDERSILDRVIAETKSLFWDAFIKHVYATYPIKVSDRYQTLNLVEMADIERKVIAKQGRESLAL